MAPKIVTIVGATGAQGKGVVSAFINNPAYKVRAITRNPSSPSSVALAAQGAEVVSADLNSLASLTSAFAGSSIIYGVTNFFEPFIAHQSPTAAMDVEFTQGVNLARAAAATASTLEHYIWSTLPNASAISGGKYLVPHFEGKNRIDAYIRTELPDLLKKTTFLWVTWYHANYTFPMFTPYFIPTAGKYVQFANFSPETPIQTIGDVSVNLGNFVSAIVENADRTRDGRTVLAATETWTAGEMLQAWAGAQNPPVRAQMVRVDGGAYRELWPLWAEEMGVMMEFWDEYAEKSWTDPKGGVVLTGKDLGVEKVQGLVEAYRGLKL